MLDLQVLFDLQYKNSAKIKETNKAVNAHLVSLI